MGQFAFVFLIVSSSLCCATVGDAAQETSPNLTIGAGNATESASSTGVSEVKSAEAGTDKVQTDQVQTDQVQTGQIQTGQIQTGQIQTGTLPLNASKKKQSFAEEFFSSPLNYFAVLVVCLYVYVMFVQPRGARNEKKLTLARLSNLKKNDRVITSAGIHGIVSNINTEAGTVTLRVDENSNAKLTIDRDAIKSVAS